jgi:hypothetical protein
MLAEALHEAYISHMIPFALIALVHLADLLQRIARFDTVVQMAVFVKYHDDVVPEAKEKAEKVLSAVIPHLPPEQCQKAQENGRAAKFTDFFPLVS